MQVLVLTLALLVTGWSTGDLWSVLEDHIANYDGHTPAPPKP